MSIYSRCYIFFTVLIFSSCATSEEKKGVSDKVPSEIKEEFIQLTKEQFQNAQIEIGRIEQKNISGILKVNGKVDVPPQNMISISVPMSGYLKQTHLLPGTHIKKGEILAIIEDQQYLELQQNFLMAKNKLVLLEKEFERQKKLQETKANSDKIFELAQNDFLNQVIVTKALAEKLKMIFIEPDSFDIKKIASTIHIPSPIKGFVSKVNMNIGKYVSPTDVLFELVNPDDIHVNLKVLEKDVAYLYKDQSLFAYSNTEPTKKYLCHIILLNKNVNEDGTIEVHCHIENHTNHFMPGMFINADIVLKNRVVTVLPEEAIVHFENKNYVFIAHENYHFQMKEIEIGSTQNGFTEIITPLSESNRIVKKGAYTLLMKAKNKVE